MGAMGAMGLEHAAEIYIFKNEYILGARPSFDKQIFA
jgi:hypothetical protein